MLDGALGRFGLDAPVKAFFEVTAELFAGGANRRTSAARLEAHDMYLLVTSAVAAGVALRLRQRTHTHARTVGTRADGNAGS